MAALLPPKGLGKKLPAADSASVPPDPASLVLDNESLSPGDLKRKCDRLGGVLGSVEMRYCYVDYMKKKPYESKLFRELVSILQKNQMLEHIKLCGMFPRHGTDVVNILKAMSEHKNLQSIFLTVPEERRVAFDLAWVPLAKKNAQLSVLRLESFDLSSDGNLSIDTMTEALQNAVGLRELFLGGCRISDKGLWRLVHGLGYMKRIRKLHLPRCGSLSMISLLTIASIINLNTELQLLDLAGNVHMFEKTVASSASTTSSHSTATSLTANDQIQSEGALTTFMRTLQTNSTLVEMRLSHCGIDDALFEYLLSSLEGNRKLQLVDLDHNNITRKVGLEQHLTEHLPRLQMAHFYLEGLKKKRKRSGDFRDDQREWSQLQLDAFLAALEGNTHLVTLRLDPVKEREEIADLLERNENLVRVRKYDKLTRVGKRSDGSSHKDLRSDSSRSSNSTRSQSKSSADPPGNRADDDDDEALKASAAISTSGDLGNDDSLDDGGSGVELADTTESHDDELSGINQTETSTESGEAEFRRI